MREFLTYIFLIFFIFTNLTFANKSYECKKIKNRISKINVKNLIQLKSLYEHALLSCGKDYDLYTNLAVINYKNGEYKESLKHTNYAKEIKDNSKVHLLLAKNYKELGDFNRYSEELRKAKYRDLTNSEVIREVFYKAIEEENYLKAITFENKVLALPKNLKEDFYNLALAYENSNDYEVALKYYKKAVTIDNTYQKAFYNMGNIYLKKNLFNEARKKLLRSLSLNATHILTLKALVRVSELSNDKIGLKKYLSKIIRNYPDDYLANYKFGYLALEDKDFVLAKKYLIKANEIKANSEILNSLGFIYMEDKNYKRAKYYFEKALVKGEYSNPKIYNNIGILYLRLKKVKKAQKMFKKALELDSSYALARKNLLLLSPKG